MALFGSKDEGYTKTGNGPLTSWANKLSYLPIIRNWKVPFLGASITAVLGFADTAIESVGWLLRGKIGSALTVAAAGTVGSAVNAIEATPFWWVNAGSGLLTGKNLGTHARALTESLIGGVTGAVGAKPQVLASYTAGMGSIGGGVAQAGPGKFFKEEAARRGANADDAYARLRSNESDHVAALEAAQGQEAYQGR